MSHPLILYLQCIDNALHVLDLDMNFFFLPGFTNNEFSVLFNQANNGSKIN